MRARGWLSIALAAALGACLPEPPPADAPPGVSVPRMPSPPLAQSPDVDLRDRESAEARGQHVVFDGVAEGLAWPSLEKALGPRGPGEPVTIQAARSVRVIDVLRAAWTVRANDVRMQTPDDAGQMRVVRLGARGAKSAGCHLAVFLREDGSLRVAAPGGPREVGGEHPAESLARALESESARCPIKYVAFGAESDDEAWGPVFDVLVAVDGENAAGEARYVLGQPMRASVRAPPP
jgi:hypothetical protein